MNVSPERYHQLSLDDRLVKILESTKSVKARIKLANRQAFLPTASSLKSKNAKGPAPTRTHHANLKSEVTGATGLVHSNPGCPNCQNKPNEEKCIRRLRVYAHDDPDWFTNVVITDAPEDDRLYPKVSFGNFGVNGTTNT